MRTQIALAPFVPILLASFALAMFACAPAEDPVAVRHPTRQLVPQQTAKTDAYEPPVEPLGAKGKYGMGKESSLVLRPAIAPRPIVAARRPPTPPPR